MGARETLRRPPALPGPHAPAQFFPSAFGRDNECAGCRFRPVAIGGATASHSESHQGKIRGRSLGTVPP